jgi:hypothetical protein
VGVRVEKPFASPISLLNPFVAFPSLLPVFKQSDKELSTPSESKLRVCPKFVAGLRVIK